jgi:hypothetical protein
MEAGLPIELWPAAVVDRPPVDGAMRAAAARVIARTRLAWVTPGPDVSAPYPARPTMELKASRALDNQPRTGD